MNTNTTKYDNLVGVFARKFPLATRDVNGTPGETRFVTYDGVHYKITGTELSAATPRYSFEVARHW